MNGVSFIEIKTVLGKMEGGRPENKGTSSVEVKKEFDVAETENGNMEQGTSSVEVKKEFDVEETENGNVEQGTSSFEVKKEFDVEETENGNMEQGTSSVEVKKDFDVEETENGNMEQGTSSVEVKKQFNLDGVDNGNMEQGILSVEVKKESDVEVEKGNIKQGTSSVKVKKEFDLEGVDEGEMEAQNVNLNFHKYSDQRLKSCLHQFVGSNNVEAVKLVVEKGISVNAFDDLGATPLYVAAMSNRSLQSMKELLKSKTVKINKQTSFDETPLYCSCEFSSYKILKTLIEHGADVNMSNCEVATPLHAACSMNGSLKSVKLLIKAGVNVNAKDGNGGTPLHHAVIFHSVKFCQYLLQHGADPGIPNNDGLLPLHVAVKKQRCEVYDFIRSNTNSHAIIECCTFPGPNLHHFNIVNRSLLCLALESHNKDLIKRVLKSGLPNDVLNCPVNVKKPFFSNYYYWKDNEFRSIPEFVLFTPLCFFLNFHWNPKFLDVLKMLLDNKVCVSNTFRRSSRQYVIGPIETILRSTVGEVDRFKIINTLLENGIDVDKEHNNTPTDLLKLCLMTTHGSGIFMLLLKASNIVEPEDILKWLAGFKNSVFMVYHFMEYPVTQEVVYALLVLSPNFTVSASECNFFLTLPRNCVEEENVSEKIRQLCEGSVRPLASYCRSVVRRQLHCETRRNRRQFTEKLNTLPAPKTVISYLKFSEVKFTINERLKSMTCQIQCDS